MRKNVVLMANDAPGLEVAKYLVSAGDIISRLYLHDVAARKYGQEIIVASKCDKANIFEASKIKDPNHLQGLKSLAPDYIITVYWAHLLSKEIINCAKEGTVNFHPALLPVNRGWYPHVHSILDGSPTGVTLHMIDEGADTGPIWAQKEVPLSEIDTAFTIYNRLQIEIVDLFKQVWPRIKNNELAPQPQNNALANFHKKSEISGIDVISPDSLVKAGDLINLLRARSFGEKGFAYYQKDGEKIYLNLRLSKTNDFRKDKNEE